MRPTTTAVFALLVALPIAMLSACSGETPAAGGAATATPVALSAPVSMTLPVDGMHCDGCEGAICGKVGKIEGVTAVKASHVTKSVEVTAPPEQREAIVAAIKRLGYKIGEAGVGEPGVGEPSPAGASDQPTASESK